MLKDEYCIKEDCKKKITGKYILTGSGPICMDCYKKMGEDNK